MNQELEALKAIYNSVFVRTTLSVATLVLATYLVHLGRKIIRRMEYTGKKVEAMHLATIEVFDNGKGNRYEQLVELQMEAWRKEQSYTDPALWKLKKMMLFFIKHIPLIK